MEEVLLTVTRKIHVLKTRGSVAGSCVFRLKQREGLEPSCRIGLCQLRDQGKAEIDPVNNSPVSLKDM